MLLRLTMSAVAIPLLSHHGNCSLSYFFYIFLNTCYYSSALSQVYYLNAESTSTMLKQSIKEYSVEEIKARPKNISN